MGVGDLIWFGHNAGHENEAPKKKAHTTPQTHHLSAVPPILSRTSTIAFMPRSQSVCQHVARPSACSRLRRGIGRSFDSAVVMSHRTSDEASQKNGMGCKSSHERANT